jgi:hypothetical protein
MAVGMTSVRARIEKPPSAPSTRVLEICAPHRRSAPGLDRCPDEALALTFQAAQEDESDVPGCRRRENFRSRESGCGRMEHSLERQREG